MADDLKRMEYTPGNCYNFHPGSHTGQGAEEGIRLISEMLNEILKTGADDHGAARLKFLHWLSYLESILELL